MKQTDKQGSKNKTGAIGEIIATVYLRKRGHEILEQNFLKKWGEIDIVSRETSKNSTTIHFTEVKTVSYGTKADLERAVSYGTWRPEENVHFKKIQRMNRTIQTWLLENNYEGAWQINVVSVRVVPREKYATVKCLMNIVY